MLRFLVPRIVDRKHRKSWGTDAIALLASPGPVVSRPSVPATTVSPWIYEDFLCCGSRIVTQAALGIWKSPLQCDSQE